MSKRKQSASSPSHDAAVASITEGVIDLTTEDNEKQPTGEVCDLTAASSQESAYPVAKWYKTHGGPRRFPPHPLVAEYKAPAGPSPVHPFRHGPPLSELSYLRLPTLDVVPLPETVAKVKDWLQLSDTNRHLIGHPQEQREVMRLARVCHTRRVPFANLRNVMLIEWAVPWRPTARLRFGAMGATRWALLAEIHDPTLTGEPWRWCIIEHDHTSDGAPTTERYNAIADQLCVRLLRRMLARRLILVGAPEPMNEPCSICYEPNRHGAVMLTCCGTRMCTTCRSKWPKKCPSCRAVKPVPVPYWSPTSVASSPPSDSASASASASSSSA